MQFEYIKKSEIPRVSDRNSGHWGIVKLFLNSGKEAAKITFESVIKAIKFACYVQLNKSKIAVKAIQSGNIVYLWKDEEVES